MWTTWSHAVVVGGSVVVVVVVLVDVLAVDVGVLELLVAVDSVVAAVVDDVDVVDDVAVVAVIGGVAVVVDSVATAASAGDVVGGSVGVLDGAAPPQAATQAVATPRISDRTRTGGDRYRPIRPAADARDASAGERASHPSRWSLTRPIACMKA